MAARNEHILEIQGRKITVRNLDKVMYPVAGFTKGQVINFYIRCSKWLLPHLKDRPVTLKRYPDGITGDFFYEKDAPGYAPDWIQTVPVPRRAGGPDIRYLLINDLATLVWCANLANLEIHPFLHRAPEIQRPTYVVFDLDPGEGADILACAKVAFLLKDTLAHLGLSSLAKVSGSKGIQVYVPLNTDVTYDDTQPFARAVAQFLERQYPALVVSEMAKSARVKKVFVDWSQNSDFKTTVGVYSLRAKRQHPFVSMPVTWDELQAALDAGDSGSLYWQPGPAIERLEDRGDLFAPVLKKKQRLPSELSAKMDNFETRKPAAARLSEYSGKRDFAKTPEPPPSTPRRSRQGGRRRFVIQKHAASRLHYDFRLEMHGVLKSWAVPKGPPYRLEDKRLAMATEDHPIEYLDFEGVIPEGQYGGGTVMVWDIGAYELMEGDYYKGHLHIFLEGKKLKGEWLLVKNAGKGDRNWLLMKVGKPMRPVSSKRDDQSALSGRSMAQIAADQDRQWQSNRATEGVQSREIPDLRKAPKAEMKFIEPMQAKLVAALPEGEPWRYELKLDGYRALAMRTRSSARLLSRRNNPLNERFGPVAEACKTLPKDTIVDGEIVVLDARGRPSFNLLQNYPGNGRPLFYYVFDLLALRGKSLLRFPLRDRRVTLEETLASAEDPIRLLGSLEAPPADLVQAAKKEGIEGFVAKRLNSVYEPGQRSGAWVKFKVNRGQELVIGGYMPGKHRFDSLLVGYYEGKKLIFTGKVKNGFTPHLRELVFQRFEGLEAERCPFANLPEPKNARRGEALTAEVMKKARWLKPELVAQIEFTDWTAANHLRHSRFAGLREDKDPREVVKETPAA
jgi:bifunctional non-homologous end joining protein LigD